MLDFLRRYQVPVGSAILLFLAGTLLSANANRAERVDPFARFVLEVVYPLQLGVTRMTAGVSHLWRGYVDLIAIRAEAEALRERVRTLEGELTRMAEVGAENLRLRRLLEIGPEVGDPLVAARVIGWDASSRDRTMTLDKGQRDGVVKGAAVLVPEGVVGHVFEASPSAARVLLISDHNSGVDALVERSRVRGIVQGRLNDCDLKYVKRGADVQAGDRLVTSGLDGIFPKGVLIGDVVQARTHKRGLFQTITVEPRVVFDRLEEVLVTTGSETEEPAADGPRDRAAWR
jgi:rod shape-determining protein MreC